MNTGAIAKRYARALAAYAAEQGEQERVILEAGQLIEAFRRYPSLGEALRSPVRTAKERLELLRAAADGRLGECMERFLALVLRHRREEQLLFILNSYLGLCKELKGIHEAELKVAHPLSEEHLERLRGSLQQLTGGELRIRESCDPALVGGFCLRIDDLLIDASLRSRLERLRRLYGENSNRIV